MRRLRLSGISGRMSIVPDRPWPTTPASTVLYTSDLLHQLRRELVVFGGAPFTGAHHLAAVEQRAGVVFTQTADGDRGRAAFDALRRETRQPRDGVRDAGVGQLADVFGADDLDDGSRFSFGGNRRLDRVADAADDHLLDFALRLLSSGFLRERIWSCAGED